MAASLPRTLSEEAPDPTGHWVSMGKWNKPDGAYSRRTAQFLIALLMVNKKGILARMATEAVEKNASGFCS